MAEEGGLDNLERLTKTTTAGELLKQRGQKKKLRTINKRDLKNFIAQEVAAAVDAAIAGTEALADEDKDRIRSEAEERVQDRLRTAQDLQQKVAEREAQNQELRERIENLAKEHDGDDSLQETLLQLQRENDELRQNYEDAQGNVDVLEHEVDNLQKMYQNSLGQKDQANQTLRQNILRTTDLVQIFLTLDQEYYGGRHQAEQDRSDIDEEDPLADFFHDFATVAAIATSLQTDLQKLREISQKSQDDSAPSTSGAGLLEEDLALLARLKAGAVNDLDLFDPVGTLATAINGLRTTVVNRAVAEGQQANVRELDEDVLDGPETVLTEASQAIREIEATVVRLSGDTPAVVAAPAAPANDAAAGRAMAEQLMQSRELIDGVQALDQDYYQGRHQKQAAANESDDPAAVLTQDYDICTAVVGTLRQDLERLSSLSATLGDGAGDESLDHHLQMLEQLKTGDVAAIDAAEPVANLVIALDGVRTEMVGLDDDTRAALDLPVPPAELPESPDPDGEDIATSLAEATNLVRALAATIARQRNLITGFQTLTAEAETSASEQADQLALLRPAAESVWAAGAHYEPAASDDAGLPERLQSLAEALARSEAAQRGQAQVQLTQLHALAADLVAAADKDSVLSDDSATVALATSVSQDTADTDLLAQSKEVAERLIARRDDLQTEIQRLQDELSQAQSAATDAAATETEVGRMSSRIAELETSVAEEQENAASIAEILKVVRDKEQRADVARNEAEEKFKQVDQENDDNRRARRRAEQAAQQLADVIEEVGRNEAALEPDGTSVAPLADLVAQLGGLLGELTADDDGEAVHETVREDFFGEVAETGEMVARTIGTRYQQVCRGLTEAREDLDQQKAALVDQTAVESAHSGAIADRERDLKKLRGRLDTAHQDNEDLVSELAKAKSSLTRTREDLSDARFEAEELQGRFDQQAAELASAQAEAEQLEQAREDLVSANDIADKRAAALITVGEHVRSMATDFDQAAGEVVTDDERSVVHRVVGKLNVSLGRDAEDRDAIAVSDQAANVLSAVAAASYQTKQGIEALRGQITEKEQAMAEANDKRSKVEISLAEVEQRLREADEHIQEHEGTMAAQATSIATLEGQREELQQRIADLQAESDELRDHIGELEASLAGEQVRLEETQQEMAALQEEHQGLEQDLADQRTDNEALQATNHELTQERDQTQERLQGIYNELAVLKQEHEQVTTERQRLQAELDGMQEVVVQHQQGQATITELNGKLRQVEADLAAASESASHGKNSLQVQVSNLKQDKNNLEEELSSARSEARSEVSALQVQLSTVQKKEEKLRQQVADNKSQIEQLNDQIEEERLKSESIEESKDVLQAQLDADMASLRQEIDEARRARDQAQNAETGLREEIVGLQAKLNALQG
jgi:chromosome segregation ATPase